MAAVESPRHTDPQFCGEVAAAAGVPRSGLVGGDEPLDVHDGQVPTGRFDVSGEVVGAADLSAFGPAVLAEQGANMFGSMPKRHSRYLITKSR